MGQFTSLHVWSMPQVVCLRRFALRDALTESNAVNELLLDIAFALSLPPLIAIWPAKPDDGDWTATLGDFVLLFMVRWVPHFASVVFSNRTKTEEFLANVTLYVLILCYTLMAVASTTCSGTGGAGQCHSILAKGYEAPLTWTVFCVALAACHAVHGIMFGRGMWHDAAGKFCRVYATGHGLIAMTWALGALAEVRSERLAVFASAIAVVCLMEVTSKLDGIFLPSAVPSHLSIRMRKFQIVGLTQVFAGLVQPRLEYSADMLGFTAGTIACIAAVKIIFFDWDQGHIGGRYLHPIWVFETLWEGFNMMLSACATLLGAACALTLRANTDPDNPLANDISIRWLFCGAFAGIMTCATAINLTLRGAGSGVRRWRKRSRILVRIVIATLCLTAGQWTSPWLPTVHLPWVVFALAAVLVSLEMYGRARRSNIVQSGGVTGEIGAMLRRKTIRVMLSPASVANMRLMPSSSFSTAGRATAVDDSSPLSSGSSLGVALLSGAATPSRSRRARLAGKRVSFGGVKHHSAARHQSHFDDEGQAIIHSEADDENDDDEDDDDDNDDESLLDGSNDGLADFMGVDEGAYAGPLVPASSLPMSDLRGVLAGLRSGVGSVQEQRPATDPTDEEREQAELVAQLRASPPPGSSEARARGETATTESSFFYFE